MVVMTAILWSQPHCSWANQMILGPYYSIVTNDPFDPDRGKKEGNELGVEEEVENDIQEHYQLYGTIITKDNKRAFIKEVSATQTKRRRRNRDAKPPEIKSVMIGDVINGWKVKEIGEKNIVLEHEGQKIELGLFDSEKKERLANAPVALQTPQLKPLPIPNIGAPQQADIKRQRGHKNGITPPRNLPASKGKIAATRSKKASNTLNQPKKATPQVLPPTIGGPRIIKPKNSPNSGGKIPSNAPQAPATNPFLEMLKQYQPR